MKHNLWEMAFGTVVAFQLRSPYFDSSVQHNWNNVDQNIHSRHLRVQGRYRHAAESDV